MAKKKVLDFFNFQLRRNLKSQNEYLKELKRTKESSKVLKEMRKFRKKGAIALGSRESVPKAKARVKSPQSLRTMTQMLRQKRLTLNKWEKSKIKGSEVTDLKKSIKRISEAKRGLSDSLVNARGKGIRFIRRRGRIIPIKPKRGK